MKKHFSSFTATLGPILWEVCRFVCEISSTKITEHEKSTRAECYLRTSFQMVMELEDVIKMASGLQTSYSLPTVATFNSMSFSVFCLPTQAQP